MPYGELRVDTITFTNGGVDTSITVSGLAASTTGNLTVTGTISGATVRATTVSGVTVTGTTVQGASGTFTSITGGVATITSGVFAAGSAAAPSISFSGDANTGIYSPGADQVAISTSGTGRLFVDASGNIGINTAPSARFHIVDTDSSSAYSAGAILGTQTSIYKQIIHTNQSSGTNEAGIVFRAGTSSNIAEWGLSAQRTGAISGDLIFRTRTGASSSNEFVRITSAGLVGIGTSAPGTRLHVLNDIEVARFSATSASTVYTTWQYGTSTSVGYVGNGGLLASGSASDFVVRSDAALAFAAGGSTERLRITSAGLVGIGTSSPTQTLHVENGNLINASLTFGASAIQTIRGTFAGSGIRELAIGVTGDSPNSPYLQARNNSSTAQALLLNPAGGNVGIGTTSPGTALQVVGTARFGDGTNGSVSLTSNASQSFYDSLNNAATGWQTAAFRATNLTFLTDASSTPIERARIDSSGRLLVGTSTARANFFNASETTYLQVEGVGNTDVSIIRNLDSTAGPNLILGKTRGNTVGSNTLVGNTDILGSISFQGADGTQFVEGAYIRATTDGTTGADDLPTRLVFATTADGASSPTERLRITSAGLVGIGVSSVGAQLDVYNSQASGISEVARLRWNNGGTGGALTYANQSGTVLGQIANVTSASGVELAFSTYNNSTALGERMRLTSTGLAIGTTSPGSLVDASSSTGTRVRSTYTSTGGARDAGFEVYGDGAVNSSFVYAGNTGVTTISSYLGTALNISGSEAARIDSSRRLLVGTSSARNNFYNSVATAQFQVEGTTFENASASLTCNSANDTQVSVLVFAKSNGTGIGSNTLVTNNTYLGAVSFMGSDGTEFVKGAEIRAEVDGTPGANDMPGRIVLSTTADGASSPTERMRITNAGNVGIGTTSPSTRLHLQGTSATYIQITDEGDGASRIGQNGTALTFGVDLADGSTERARIDSSGRLLVGTPTSRSNIDTLAPQLQIEGISESGSALSITRNVDGAGCSFLYLNKTRGSAVGQNTIVQSGDAIAILNFGAADGTKIIPAASVSAYVDGTPGADDMPGRLVFSTTADGASFPTERMRIGQDGTSRIFASNYGLAIGNGQTAGTTYTAFEVYSGATSTTSLGTLGLHILNNGNVQNTNNSYGAFSDIKLKENIVDATSQWSDIKALQVRKYNFKEGQTHTQIGLIAQEVELVSPGLVSESPDRDAEGNDLGTVTKSVNYSVLYMKAVKALQEAMLRIEDLEARLDAANL